MGAKTVKVPQIQFQFSDTVVVVVGWGAAAAGAECAWLPVRPGGFWKNFLLRAPCRAVRTWKSGHCLYPRIFQSSVFGVALSTLFSGRVLGSTVDTCLREAFGEFHIFSTCGALRSWRSSSFRRMEKCAQLMLRVAVSLDALRTLSLDIISTSSSCDGVG